jgi:hypothetical protein
MQLKSFKKKDFNNAMGQESLTPLINLKRKNKQKPKSAVENRPTGENKIIANNKTSKYHPSGASEKKPAITRKPIIITKNEAKK